MLIAMAGLPGTGKSTLATRLAKELGGVVLSKDEVRAVLFPGPVLDYSSHENQISMRAIFQAVAYIRTTFPDRPVLIDGRTFLQPSQLADLFAVADALKESPRILECVCSDEIARRRLETDLTLGTHKAKDRTYDRYLAVKEKASAIPLPHLVLDTGSTSLEECVWRCLGYLRETGERGRQG
jgi:predicted kinase